MLLLFVIQILECYFGWISSDRTEITANTREIFSAFAAAAPEKCSGGDRKLCLSETLPNTLATNEKGKNRKKRAYFEFSKQRILFMFTEKHVT